MSKAHVAIAFTGACLLGLIQPAVAHAQRNPGVSQVCGEYLVLIPILIPTPLPIPIPIMFNRPDEGWAYVDASRKRRQATGIAFEVQTASNDTPANHYSHDLDFKILLDPDPEYEDLLSIENEVGLPVEWETGIRPWEKKGDGANPIFPKWAWPGQNDRVWVDGNWIYDCGHPDDDTGLYYSEIHPARAIATMRERSATLPGTGLTPVPATLTDLYISGNGGYAPNQLNCGPQIILGDHGDTCGHETPPANESYKTTPINDTDFSFFMCLPPRPSANAVLSKLIAPGPGNTVGIELTAEPVPTAKYCVDPGYDATTMLEVKVPLKGTPTPPTAVYARKIYAGWLVPPDPVLPHRQVTVTKTDLHEDHDGDPGDGELSFWFLNVNLAEFGWLRLHDYADGNMNDYDDDDLIGTGDGEMTFTGANRDFYMRPDQSVTIESQGYEQDCFDNAFSPFPDGYWYTVRKMHLSMYIACYADLFDKGTGDRQGRTRVSFDADALGPQKISHSGDEYDIYLTIDELPITVEDESYLSIHPECTPAGEVALVGEELDCVTLVHNAGTGLPRKVEITSQFSGPPAPTIDEATWSIPGPLGTAETDCLIGSTVLCRPTTVLVALKTPVIMAMTVIPTAPGLLTERAEVKTASTDPDLTNNVKTTTIEVFKRVTVDVAPRSDTNEVNSGRGGTVTVAILTTADFNATSVDPLSVCFGDSGTPAERTCTEQHGEGHLQDVNKDKLLDLVLHFEVADTGIDLTDSSACLLARTKDGIGLYGCDAITVRPPQ
jgi:hypothetical protein